MRHYLLALCLSIGLIILAATQSVTKVSALAPTPTVTPLPEVTPTPTNTPFPANQPDFVHAESNTNCMMCHANPDFRGTFKNGETISLYVNPNDLTASVHGDGGLKCEACHTDKKTYPHTEKGLVSCRECHDSNGGNLDTKFVSISVRMPYESPRSMVLGINENCRSCHAGEFSKTMGSAHEKVFESGNVNAPQCVDCHGGHQVVKPGAPRTVILEICGKCHASVYSSFKVSVHGETLLNDSSNPDVPTCINCHGVHSVQGPREETFRGNSIVACGGCHNNQAMMSKYGISTKVFDTYLNDYHGRTVSLFQEAGKLSSNKATCYDCHGIHNIRRPEDSLSSVYPANLQKTCQQCHADASIRFPAAWLSHTEISWEKTPLLFGIQAAYTWALIPGTLGSFIVYIFLDARRRWLDKRSVVLEALAEEDLEDEYDFEK